MLFGISKHLLLLSNLEITIEVNPGTVTEEHLISYKNIGITRISLGVQTFNTKQLIKLGRIHQPTEATNTALLVSNIGFNSLNLDLMYGLPNQTINQSLNDLRNAIALVPQHISWYQLVIEPKTIFGYNPPQLPNEEILWDIYNQGHELLITSGYQQYEISNYAKPGYQCLHNINYWRFGDYLGIGCGAHSKLTQVDGTVLRIVKKKHPLVYMDGKYVEKYYQVSQIDLPFEYFMNRFRLLETIPRQEFTKLTSLNESTIRFALDQALSYGYIYESDTTWTITEHGKLFLNSLLELFI
ncbi:putative oxygen-independent coproporphyrinogen III oxidase [Candidatus Palibaumannia cicadellinicola]|uniref:Heme chaperone HemW n=1 Tax=Candidatus Palibaumannia cicadellinicola TaxID=186490 RepID=A0A0K2BL29_9GAMM|nr:putative oxygen-independent coproporphyrinogen III oxidase [Candidatus Baumannia cicadellinicola]